MKKHNHLRKGLALVLGWMLLCLCMTAMAEVMITVTGSDGSVISQTEGVADESNESSGAAETTAPAADERQTSAPTDDGSASVYGS